MSNRVLSIFVAVVGLICLQASCRNTKIGGSSDCPKKEMEVLSAVLKQEIQKEISFYYSKIKVSIKDSQSSNSFNATVKMKPDSAFAGTVKVAGIMGAGYLIDQDTFAYKNKIHKCYKKESFNVLSETFGTEVSYSFLQQLILGQAIGIEKVEQLYPLKNDQFYVLASHDKKVFQRLEAYNLNDEEVEDIFIKYILECEELTLVRIVINIPKDSVVVEINFTKRQLVQGINLPEETNIKIVSPKDSTFIDLDYGKTSLNEIKKIILKIPDTYNECK